METLPLKQTFQNAHSTRRGRNPRCKQNLVTMAWGLAMACVLGRMRGEPAQWISWFSYFSGSSGNRVGKSRAE